MDWENVLNSLLNCCLTERLASIPLQRNLLFFVGEMEIPDSNDPLGHMDGLERPIPTPKGKMNCNFSTLLKYKHSSEMTNKILL